MRSPARLLALLCLISMANRLGAQEWHSGPALDLIVRATEARLRRDADTVLAGWQASARGVVRFTVEVDHGNGPIERVIRADELRLEVYGEAPNRSKQVITAWRDTTFQPTGIVYHRDHLGIVANDFGPMIRLGEGEEVRDVPHPLSAAGLGWYEFRLRDTFRIRSSTGTVQAVRVEMRPRDPASAGIIGVMLIDSDRAALVSLGFTFTAASYRDATVASIAVSLENALHESSRWLPWRQSIAIRRAAPAVVLPLSSVIHADWVIDDYRLGVQHPPGRFGGASIEGPGRPQTDSAWSEPWPSAPDALPPSVVRLTAVNDHARSMARALLDGLPTLRVLSSDGASQLLRVNRVQGVTLGAGVRWQAPTNVILDANAAFGTSDGRATGRVGVSRMFGKMRIELSGGRAVRDMHEWARRSGVANSMASLIDGSDAGDWYRSDELELAVELRPWPTLVARYGLRKESTVPVRTAFNPLSGSSLDNPVLGAGEAVVTTGSVSTFGPDGRGVRVSTESSRLGAEGGWWRAALEAAGTLPAGLEWRLRVGVGNRHLPAHRSFVAGGAGSLPGTVPRAIGGRQLGVVELARPFGVSLPAPIAPRLAGNALDSRLIPFAALGIAREPVDGMSWQATGDLVPVLGARLDLWGPLLRLELGWAPRSGGISLMLDAHPDWWPIL